jgi:arsenate reductase (thioredoxin)
MNVLFICPHGVAKSVIAAAYTEHLAREFQLELNVNNAGTEPDPAIPLKVIDLLASYGLDVSSWTSKLVIPAMLEESDLVISLGCDLTAFNVPEHKTRTWIVPSPSENLIACHDAIKTRVSQLIAELSL